MKLRFPSALLLFLSLTGHLGSQQHETNPFRSPEDLAEGRRLYRMNCGFCHGMDGKSGPVAPLASGTRRRGNSDREMFQVIANGIPGTGMPALRLGEDAAWKILLFVRALEEADVQACPAEPGDPAQGARLFLTKGSCQTCHTVGVEGGRLGPDLTWSGAAHSRKQFHESLVDPHKNVPSSYRTIRVVTNENRRLEGVLINEDDYTLHMMDRRENIHSFSKSDLREIERPSGSLMPAYGDLFSEDEMHNLLAYLCSLRGPKEAKE